MRMSQSLKLLCITGVKRYLDDHSHFLVGMVHIGHMAHVGCVAQSR